MEFIITRNYTEMSELAAKMIAKELHRKPKLVIALPTGGTPIKTLEELSNMYQKDNLDFSKMISFNIDEYISLGKDNAQSYYYFLNKYLYKNVNINLENTHVPNVFNNLDEEVKIYENKIADYGYFDVILLGIGHDGHIGFNEPSLSHKANCHVVALNKETIEANSRFFDNVNDVPIKALTLGMGTILKSKKIILIANGKSKAEIMQSLHNTYTVDPMFPASFLLTHFDVTIICDQEAASGFDN